MPLLKPFFESLETGMLGPSNGSIALASRTSKGGTSKRSISALKPSSRSGVRYNMDENTSENSASTYPESGRLVKKESVSGLHHH